MRQRFLVLQDSAGSAHAKFPDPGGVSISAMGPEVVGFVMSALARRTDVAQNDGQVRRSRAR